MSRLSELQEKFKDHPSRQPPPRELNDDDIAYGAYPDPYPRDELYPDSRLVQDWLRERFEEEPESPDRTFKEDLLVLHQPMLVTWHWLWFCPTCENHHVPPRHHMASGMYWFNEDGTSGGESNPGPLMKPGADYPCSTIRRLLDMYSEHPEFWKVRDGWRPPPPPKQPVEYDEDGRVLRYNIGLDGGPMTATVMWASEDLLDVGHVFVQAKGPEDVLVGEYVYNGTAIVWRQYTEDPVTQVLMTGLSSSTGSTVMTL